MTFWRKKMLMRKVKRIKKAKIVLKRRFLANLTNNPLSNPPKLPHLLKFNQNQNQVPTLMTLTCNFIKMLKIYYKTIPKRLIK